MDAYHIMERIFGVSSCFKMKQAKHCDLCKFPQRDFKIGLTCGLTDKKPVFKNTCPDIKFSNLFKNHLPELLSQIEHLKKQKTSVYVNFTLFGVIGLITIISTFRFHFEKTFEFDFSYTSYHYLCGTLLLFLVGIGLISEAFRRLNIHRNSLRKLFAEKREINKVLNNYDLDIRKILNQKLN